MGSGGSEVRWRDGLYISFPSRPTRRCCRFLPFSFSTSSVWCPHTFFLQFSRTPAVFLRWFRSHAFGGCAETEKREYKVRSSVFSAPQLILSLLQYYSKIHNCFALFLWAPAAMARTGQQSLSPHFFFRLLDLLSCSVPHSPSLACYLSILLTRAPTTRHVATRGDIFVSHFRHIFDRQR